MKNHCHYFHWTIEWEENDNHQLQFYIYCEILDTTHEATIWTAYKVDTTKDVESSVARCKRLIDEIVERQRLLNEELVAEWNDAIKSPVIPSAIEVFSDEDVDKIPF
jgi:hypothetical protein